jgi:hypothetical protein
MRQVPKSALAAFALVASALAAFACSGAGSNDVRGRGLSVASLPASAQARVYEAAARSAFDVSDPSLVLLVDPRELPRVVGLAPGGRLPDVVMSELKSGGVIRGTCEPPLTGVVGAPRCKAERPGYVLRFSPVFTIRGDSTQVYLYAQQYGTAQSGVVPTLRFERAYQVVKHDGAWHAVREGRVPKEVRGERK